MKLSIVGTGNVAHHLGSLFKKAGVQFAEVYGRSSDKALDLSKKLNCHPSDSISKLTGDLILICVADDVIPKIVSSISTDKYVVYTSGSMQLNECGRTENTGVLYPLQTLKKGSELTTSDLPLLIEAQSAVLLAEINKLAQMISNNVHQVSSENRLYYHLSAVWMNNFTNHLVYIAQDLLHERNLDVELLKSLLRETAEKLKQGDPFYAQTGPARRGDKRIIEVHQSLLSGNQQTLYALLSECIQQTYHKDDQL
jgi:predicted short-subunit dehydrogenase-like oxidoreductase (DUF2520 family)